ncbi:MAG: hypothetical protein LH609_20635 [Rudanella sp.]|nr:hypothetical protein [Rudanella sp.]
MNTALPTMPTSILLTCRTQHQHWATDLAQREDDIDQIISLLADLPGETYRSLNHRVIEYVQKLQQLKAHIHGLLTEVVCSGIACSSMSMASVTCPDPHFAPHISGNSLIASASSEYDQIKDRCQAFFSELMRLNLI